MSAVCCQVEVSATSWSLVQMSPTDCGASLCVIYKAREWGDPGPLGAVAPKTKQNPIKFSTDFYYVFGSCVVFITDPLYCVECVDGSESLIEIDVNNSDVASCEMLTQRLPREAEKYNVVY
jgi:hypothetical protein